MATFWTFHAIDHAALAGILGGADEETADAVAAIVSDPDSFEWDEPERMADIARRALLAGLSYDGADAEETEVLDALIGLFIADDGLSERVGAEPLSPRGLTWKAVGELKKRAAGGRVETRLLGLLHDGGRRFGRNQGETCSYLILDPAEVAAMRDEALAVAAVDAPWSHPDLGPFIADELIGP